jgi:hypothetical protein
MNRGATFASGVLGVGLLLCVSSLLAGERPKEADERLLIRPGEEEIVVQYQGRTLCCCSRRSVAAFLRKPDSFVEGLQEVDAVIPGCEMKCFVTDRCLEEMTYKGCVVCRIADIGEQRGRRRIDPK